MDFYLREKSSKTQLVFPIIPNEVNMTSGANTIPINIIKTGEAKMPRGEKATGWSWDGVFPGKSMRGYSFVNNGVKADWKEPRKLVEQLKRWKKNNTKLTLVIDKIANEDVFVDVFNVKYYGAGHCKYSITLTIYPDLTITTSPAPAPKKSSGKSKKTGKVTGSKVVYRKGPGKTYKKLGTLKKGAEVTIYATKGNWYKIKEGTPEWWICSSYVTVTSGKASEQKTTSTKRTSTKSKGGNTKTDNGNKKPLTFNVPSTRLTRTSTATVVAKPATTKPLLPGMRGDLIK